MLPPGAVTWTSITVTVPFRIVVRLGPVVPVLLFMYSSRRSRQTTFRCEEDAITVNSLQ